MELIEQHYRDNYSKLVGYLQHGGLSVHDAEDIVQEAYTRAVEYFHAYDPTNDFGGWFTGILRSCRKTHVMKEMLHGAIFEECILPDERFHLDIDDPEKVLSAKEILNDIRELIETKPVNQTVILSLFFLAQLTYNDISRIVPSSKQTIWNTIALFRKELKEKGIL